MNKIFWLKNLKERDHSEKLGVDGRIILEWILGKYCGRWWTGCICLRIGQETGCFEHGYEPSSSIEGGEFLD
jgi:hypothetical protein